MWVHEPDTFFGGTDKEIREKRNFFINRPVPKKFLWENFLGHPPRKSLRTHHSDKMLKKLKQNFGPCFGLPKLGECDKMRSISKIMTFEKKNRYGHNFQNVGSKMNKRLVLVYDPTLIRFGSDILKILAVSVFRNGSF